MAVPVVADIDFDLRHTTVHFGKMLVMVVMAVECTVVERIPNELVSMAEHAPN